MWKVLVVILLLAIVVGINYLVVESLWWWGYFQTTYNHTNGRTCQRLNGTERGSDDIHFIDDGLAFISSSIRKDSGNNTEGKIFMVDMKTSPPEAEELTIDYKDGDFKLFQPYGMSSWTDPANQDRVYLYVISRHPKQAVFKFLYEKSTTAKKLTYMKRIANVPEFVSLNDLVVIGEDRFYFTNDKKYCYTMELVFRLPFGSIGLYSNGSGTLVEEKLFMPNGLALSPDKQLLYVGITGSREIRVYTILADGQLSLNNTIKLSTSVNDLFVHPSGDIWLAALPVTYKVLRLQWCPESRAPSQIMRVKMLSSWQADKIEEVYSNDGTEISMSASVVVYNNAMLIGTVVTDAYYCRPGTSI